MEYHRGRRRYVARLTTKGFSLPVTRLSARATVVEAIGGGRRAAYSIDKYLRGEEVKVPDNIRKEIFDKATDEDLKGITKEKRAKMPELTVDQRRESFVEVELGLSREDAMKEAQRCLQCGLYCFNRPPDWTS